MRSKFTIAIFVSLLAITTLLTGCGTKEKSPKDSTAKGQVETTLKNQDGEEVVIPNDKPTLVFFYTTYT
jgi:cytochrome oxidase Cu insertion factor (SCO1/SenC/PrrC family)